jgi:hypothetical protein
MRKILGLVLMLFPLVGMAQKLSKADKVLVQNIQNHIKYLASDELEGRRAGSVGEQKAVDYIVAQYQALGIQPMGVDGYSPSPFRMSNTLMASVRGLLAPYLNPSAMIG